MLALPAAAQDLAGKTVTIVVPFTPGAVSDPLARVIAPRLAEILGANVIVENKAGGNTNIGSLYVAKAQPDGRTLLFAGTGITMNVAIYKDKMPFDPLKDFAPIALVSTSNSVLVVNPSLNVANLNELIALLKSKPGALNYASAGSGNMTHLIMEFFKLKSGTDIVHVPYRGAGPALNDVLAGHAAMMVINPGPTEAHVKAGRLRALAVTGVKRSDLLPEVPTFAELGLPDAGDRLRHHVRHAGAGRNAARDDRHAAQSAHGGARRPAVAAAHQINGLRGHAHLAGAIRRHPARSGRKMAAADRARRNRR